MVVASKPAWARLPVQPHRYPGHGAGAAARCARRDAAARPPHRRRRLLRGRPRRAGDQAGSPRPGRARPAGAAGGSIKEHLPPGVGAHQRPMPARPLHALWGRWDTPRLQLVRRRGRRRARHELRGAAHGLGRHRDLGAPPHAAPLPLAARRGDTGLPRAHPPGAGARGLGPHRLRLRRGRGDRRLRGRPRPGAGLCIPACPSCPPSRSRTSRSCSADCSLRGATRYCLAVGTAEPR